MSELEISKTLPQLTSKQAAARTEQNKLIGKAGPVSLYLQVKQGGLQAENTTMEKYCHKVYGIEVRTGQYWMACVKAMMTLNRMSDDRLLEIWTGDKTQMPELPPRDVAVVVNSSDQEMSILAWDRFKAIRSAPTLSTEGNAASFKRLLGHGKEESGVHNVHPSQDQKQPEIVISAPAETTPNTQYTGPRCDTCGEPCAKGQALCGDCKKQPDATKNIDKILPVVKVEEPIRQAVHPDFIAILEECGIEEETRPVPPMKSISVLTVCGAVRTGEYPYTWTLRLTDGNGHEHTALLSQKVLDTATIQ